MSYPIALLAALAAGAAGFMLRRRLPGLSKALVGLACLGCAGVLVLQVRQLFYSPDSQPPNRAHKVVGYYFANEIQQEAGGRPGSAVLILPEKGALSDDDAESYENGLRGPLLRGHPELSVQTVRLEKSQGKGTAKPTLAAFKQAIAKYPNALVYVSYAGVPLDIDDLFPADQSASVPWHVFDPDGTANWLASLKKSHIRSVIVPKPGVDLVANATIGGPPNEIFERLYLFATPRSADNVAAQIGKK